jgi:RimJ/RimL family protein N-acetyltransferase
VAAAALSIAPLPEAQETSMFTTTAATRQFDRLTLLTARLALRPLQEADAAALFDVFSDPRVMRYWSSPPWTDVARARELIATDREALHGGEYVRLGLQTRETGELVGTCTLFNFNAQCRRAEMGYALRGAWWGRGYMHEALLALLGFGFGELGLHRVEADVDPRNLASVKSLERLGFRKEGHLRERWIVNGEVSDSGLYGLLEHEWVAGARRASQL